MSVPAVSHPHKLPENICPITEMISTEKKFATSSAVLRRKQSDHSCRVGLERLRVYYYVTST